jgi:CBS domain-containing protein
VNLLLRGVEVREVMSPDVISVQMGSPILEVLELITEKSVTGVVVVDKNGNCRGIISTFDLLGAFNEMTFEEIRSLKAEDVMTKYAIDIDQRESLDEASRIMQEFRIHRLVVVSEEYKRFKPIGILSSTDIVRFLRERLSQAQPS